MIKKLVAIGGGENGRKLENGLYAPYNTEKIDREIVKLANKKSPNFFVFGTCYESFKKNRRRLLHYNDENIRG